MRTVLCLCALVFLCAATPARDWRDVSVESADGLGRGYRIGGGYVLTVAHVLCDRGSCAFRADVNGNSARVLKRGGGGQSDDSADDGCDWGLLYCERYSADPDCELREPVEGDVLTYRGKSATVRIVSDGAAGFDGERPVPGDSGSGVIDADGKLCGLLTTRMRGGADDPEGYFCSVGPEILAAIDAARNKE